MATRPSDPGYGDPLAPVGSPEWAKRWRLEFQNVALSLPQTPGRAVRYYNLGAEHRAWTLLADADGNPFPDFDAFCACPQPYGLEMDPKKFRAYLEAELGKKDADLVTVPPDGRANRERDEDGTFKPSDQKGNGCPNGSSPRKEKNLRAVLRAPEVVQQMYREGLVSQTEAAKLGPKSPTPEQAARVAEKRQELEREYRALPAPPKDLFDAGAAERAKEARRAFRVRAKEIIHGAAAPGRLERIRKLWLELTPEERTRFLSEIKE